jgi:hypothetical protein
MVISQLQWPAIPVFDSLDDVIGYAVPEFPVWISGFGTLFASDTNNILHPANWHIPPWEHNLESVHCSALEVLLLVPWEPELGPVQAGIEPMLVEKNDNNCCAVCPQIGRQYVHLPAEPAPGSSG